MTDEPQRRRSVMAEAKPKTAKLDGRTKRARQLKEHAAHMERLSASLTRLQDPDYVVKIIEECQRRGLIPSD